MGPTAWELDHPDGRRAVYRLPPGHIVERTHFGMTGQAWPMPAVPLTWPIESEQDRSGNRISYHYFIDGGIEYPYYIDYTECASAPCAFTRSRQIYFNFVLRPPSDYSERWINGARLQRRLRS